MADAYDCIVIGSGPGGYVAAIRAAQLGMKTAVVEKDDVVGGRCLNYACIPAKAVLRVGRRALRDRRRRGVRHHGQRRAPTVDFAAVGKRRDKVVKTLTGGVSGLFKKNNIEVIERPRLGDRRRQRQGRRELRRHRVRGVQGGDPRHRLAWPKPLPGTQFGGRVIDTAGAWLLAELPERMAVIGAGASGAEIASALRATGRRGACCSRGSTASCRPRTPTSPRWPSARSRSRASTIAHRHLRRERRGHRRRACTFTYGDESRPRSTTS